MQSAALKQIRTCTDSPLSGAFFSNQNIERLQGSIIQRVYETMNVRIGNQTQDDLVNVMVHVFENFARFGTDPRCEVRKLNVIVVDRCVEMMMPNIVHYIKYIEKLNKPVSLMDRPKDTTSKGRATLPGYFG